MSEFVQNQSNPYAYLQHAMDVMSANNGNGCRTYGLNHDNCGYPSEFVAFDADDTKNTKPISYLTFEFSGKGGKLLKEIYDECEGDENDYTCTYTYNTDGTVTKDYDYKKEDKADISVIIDQNGNVVDLTAEEI